MTLPGRQQAPEGSLASERNRPHARAQSQMPAHTTAHMAEQVTDNWLRLLERLDRERAAMNQFGNELRQALACRRGVTSLEYGILAGVLATVLFGGIQFFGTALKNKFLQEAAYLS